MVDPIIAEAVEARLEKVHGPNGDILGDFPGHHQIVRPPIHEASEANVIPVIVFLYFTLKHVGCTCLETQLVHVVLKAKTGAPQQSQLDPQYLVELSLPETLDL